MHKNRECVFLNYQLKLQNQHSGFPIPFRDVQEWTLKGSLGKDCQLGHGHAMLSDDVVPCQSSYPLFAIATHPINIPIDFARNSP